MMALILSLFKANKVTKKWDCKQGTIYPSDTGDFKIIFILLTALITFYMRLTPIGFQSSGFK